MIRAALALFVSICFAQLVVGQKNEIPESEFLAKEIFANQAITKFNRRSIRTLEYFEERSKPGHLSERHIEEVLLPNKWRKIEEKDYAGKKTREERIWDGTALYVKSDDGEWKRYSGGSGTGARTESGRITKTYRYLGVSGLDGKQVETYQVQSVRVANKFSANDMVVVNMSAIVDTGSTQAAGS